tara:strand:- start:17898 stop:18443 length:546 start_codon:yes stop_codon:yes gene_type:complete
MQGVITAPERAFRRDRVTLSASEDSRPISLVHRRFTFGRIAGKMVVSDRKKHTELNVLRWLSVLPCAYLAHWLMQRFAFALFSFLRGPGYPEFLFPLFQYLPSGFVLIFAGISVAPSRKVAVSIGLAVVWLPLVWLTHVFGQSSVGLVNYMHATGDSLGTLVGVALIVHRVRQSRRLTNNL